MRQPSVADPDHFGFGRGSRARRREFESMGFISELRHPTKLYTKLVIALLTLAFFILLAMGAISGFLVYRIVLPVRSRSDVDLKNLPGHPLVLTFNVSGEGQRDGWFFPGLKNAPAIVLCPAYDWSRTELLTLASSLQDQQYNVMLFDFSGHGSAAGQSTLGFREVAELRAAMDAVANRGDVDANHFGLWGVDMGAYVALSEAVGDKRVTAIVAESPYEHPNDMVAVEISRSGLGSLPFITSLSEVIFQWLNPPFRNVPPLRARIPKFSGVNQLYLQTPEEPMLATSTSELFRVSPPPHELVTLEHGNYAAMLDDEKRNYENRIESFFLINLPLVGPEPGNK
jgi:pimeloyl-ACP methyl ester carboxylesterase